MPDGLVRLRHSPPECASPRTPCGPGTGVDLGAETGAVRPIPALMRLMSWSRVGHGLDEAELYGKAPHQLPSTVGGRWPGWQVFPEEAVAEQIQGDVCRKRKREPQRANGCPGAHCTSRRPVAHSQDHTQDFRLFPSFLFPVAVDCGARSTFICGGLCWPQKRGVLGSCGVNMQKEFNVCVLPC